MKRGVRVTYRTKLSYLTTWSRHSKRLKYYGKGIAHHITPYAVCRGATGRLLEAFRAHPDRGEMETRATYYNRLSEAFGAATAPRISEIERRQSRYFIDLNEHSKGFGPDRRLWYLFCDNVSVPDQPSVAKSRPIGSGNENVIILNLDKIRHFTWSGDNLPFREKKPAAVWRGSPNTERRKILIEKFYDHPTFDIGHFNDVVNGRPAKPSLTHEDQKRFRFFLSLEGVDVATNLKWGMASNMLVMSPALEFETWFMEGKLEPGKHFVLLENDFSDLEDKVAYYTEHTEEAEAIIANAHTWIAQFGDPLKERMVSARVLEKYFELSGQM
jgi:hypothetical protein